MLEPLKPDHRFFAQYRYAIVDAERREEIPDNWPVAPVAPAFLKSDTARCPLLVDCAGIPDAERYCLLDRLEAETETKEESFVSLALASQENFKALQRHLAERLVIRHSVDKQPRQFRYYDPGTFIQLPDILGDAGMSWLLGPIEAVAIPRFGEWRSLRNPGKADHRGFDIRRFADPLQAFSVVNRVLTQLPEACDQPAWCNKAIETRRIVEHARTTYGLDQRDDLVAFALHAWRWHPVFDRHPTIQKLLTELSKAGPEDELDYREITARLDEADWQKIAQDLTAAANQQGTMQ